MVYRGEYQALSIIPLILLNISYIHTKNVYFIVIASVVLIIVALIKYELHINEQDLLFSACIFNRRIYIRKTTSEQIKLIKFKRVGWSTKSAVIKTNKGMNLHIVQFTPKTILQHLEEYSSQNNIEIVKSKDYKLLEKYYSA